MKVIRIIQDISEDGYVHLQVPQDMGKKVEIIIIPLNRERMDDSYNLMRLQELNGFAHKMLASEAEDVWNDI